MTVDEGNELIAVYMEAVIEQWYPENKLEKMTGRYAVYPKDKYPANEKHCGISMLKYHSDWNWIIPVADKVMNELWGNTKIKHPDTWAYNNLRTGLITLKIDEVWRTTVEAIKVINSIKEGTDGTNG